MLSDFGAKAVTEWGLGVGLVFVEAGSSGNWFVVPRGKDPSLECVSVMFISVAP